ncbi:MAG: ATP-binding protein, partial [Candidatus Paceibacterota bacterium]
MNKFYNREKELAMLARISLQSEQRSQFTVMTGRRRIGKTQLLLKANEDKSFLYFFVAKKSEVLLCIDFQAEIQKKLGVPILGTAISFTSIFEYLFSYAKNKPLTLVIDEFQEFMHVAPSIFSDLQRLWDLNYKNTKLNLIVSGSVISMMYHLFENKGEPLFGRANHKIQLKPFETSVLKEILHDHSPKYKQEDLLALFTFTGGVAKYIELLMDNKAYTKDKMIDYLTEENSLLLNEGKNMLVEEFGREYSTYFSILSEIAQGKNKRSELEQALQREIGGYLTKMERDFSLIKRSSPIFSTKSETKTMKYVIEDNFLIYWFRFIFKYQHMLEIGAHEQLKRIILRDYETFSGVMLEKYFRIKAIESGIYTNIGSYWDRKGLLEIDYIALNEVDKTITLGEVKRQAKKINLNDVKQKL